LYHSLHLPTRLRLLHTSIIHRIAHIRIIDSSVSVLPAPNVLAELPDFRPFIIEYSVVSKNGWGTVYK
jgi:hypothetical protein